MLNMEIPGPLPLSMQKLDKNKYPHCRKPIYANNALLTFATGVNDLFFYNFPYNFSGILGG